MLDPDRRHLLKLPCASLWVGPCMALGLASRALAAAPRADSPRVGVDPDVLGSGLGARWGSAMKRDLGWAAQWARLESSAVLTQLEQGEIDVGLFLAHAKADALDQQGLIHDRHTLAQTDVLLVGPMDDPAGIRSERDAGRALAQVVAAYAAGAAQWEPPATASALASVADGLTQGLASRGLGGKSGLSNKAGASYRLLTAAQWASLVPSRGRDTSKVFLQGKPAVSLNLQVARSFRARHPGGKLLVAWLQGPVASAAVRASAPAWRVAKG